MIIRMIIITNNNNNSNSNEQQQQQQGTNSITDTNKTLRGYKG